MNDNFLDEYASYCAEITDAPLDFHIYLPLALAGVCIGRKRWIEDGDDFIFPNFYMVLVAPTKFFRKSHCLSRGRRLLNTVFPEAVYPEEFSHEGMLDIIMNQPQGVFFYDEIKNLFGQLSKDYNASTKSFLTSMTGCPPLYRRKLKGAEPQIIKDPFLNILAASTPDWLLESISRKDIAGGFANRFMLVIGSQKTRNDYRSRKADKTKFKRLEDLLLNIKNCPAHEMLFTSEAEKLYENFYYETFEPVCKQNTGTQEIFMRLDLYCQKIAMVRETCKDIFSNEITAETMQEAIGLTENLIDELKIFAKENISLTKSDEEEMGILRIMKTQPKIGHSRLLQLSHCKAFEFGRIISSLKEKEFILEISEKASNGKMERTYSLNS